MSFLAFVGAACLEFAPPLSGDITPTPTRTATPTVEPTATPVPASPTLTSTVTPTITATRTPTPESPRPTLNPQTGLWEVPAFQPPTGQPLPAPSLTQQPAAAVPAALGTVLAPKPAAAVDGASSVSPVWGCDGDERIDFVPTEPRLGDKVFIFVTGMRDRAFASLIGPQVSGVVGQTAPGGSGLKQVWQFTPPSVGAYTFYFYGGPFPEHLCVSASLRVGSAASAGAGLMTATPTSSPTPVGSPRPDH